MRRELSTGYKEMTRWAVTVVDTRGKRHVFGMSAPLTKSAEARAGVVVEKGVETLRAEALVAAMYAAVTRRIVVASATIDELIEI